MLNTNAFTHRNFVSGSAAAGTVGLMDLYAAGPGGHGAAQAAPAAATDYAVLDGSSASAADEAVEADVVVVGCGVSGMIAASGAECRWECEVTNLLGKDGAITGVRMVDAEGKTVDIKAANTVVCTGGFIQNLDLVAKYYGGARMYGAGSPYNDGAGVQLCQTAGAQMGKNFSTAGRPGCFSCCASDFP